MAQEVKCDGCGVRESLDLSEKQRRIRPVRVGWAVDAFDREWADLERHDADLCGNCRGTLLHMYFAVPAEGQLEVPAFAEPTEQERLRAVE